VRFPYQRILSALAAFVALLLVLWSGLPLLAPLYLLFSLVALLEYTTMMSLRGIRVRRRSLYVATILTLPASLPVTYPGMAPPFDGASWREALLVMFALYLLTLEIIKPASEPISRVVYTLFGYLYIPWLFGYLITLRYTPDGVLGFYYLALPALAIIASDSGAYIIGTLFGKRKLAPMISPNKTLEGAFGGLGLAILIVSLASVGLEHWLGLRIKLYDGILFSILVASAAQLGDLFESLLKRWAGVKDSGLFLPGMAGR